VEHPEVGQLLTPGFPFRIAEGPVRVGAPPILGQHNTEVFEGLLGLTSETLTGLHRAGVV
jgi:formyl-CoA transferase